MARDVAGLTPEWFTRALEHAGFDGNVTDAAPLSVTGDLVFFPSGDPQRKLTGERGFARARQARHENHHGYY